MNTNNSDLSDAESIASLEADLEFKEVGVELFDLATDVDQNQSQRKKEKKTNQIDATKHVKLPNEIFDYIHVE